MDDILLALGLSQPSTTKYVVVCHFNFLIPYTDLLLIFTGSQL